MRMLMICIHRASEWIKWTNNQENYTQLEGMIYQNSLDLPCIMLLWTSWSKFWNDGKKASANATARKIWSRQQSSSLDSCMQKIVTANRKKHFCHHHIHSCLLFHAAFFSFQDWECCTKIVFSLLYCFYHYIYWVSSSQPNDLWYHTHFFHVVSMFYYGIAWLLMLKCDSNAIRRLCLPIDTNLNFLFIANDLDGFRLLSVVWVIFTTSGIIKMIKEHWIDFILNMN